METSNSIYHQTVVIDGNECLIEYKNIKIGDTIYDKNSETSFEATIMDADNTGWVVTVRNLEEV